MSELEIISYKPESNSNQEINVRIEDDSVWLTQLQMIELFDTSKQNISLHINNIFKENELEKKSVVKYSLTTAADGKSYKTAFYNLDVIISAGYRIKSRRGTQFRIWATKVLRDYLLKGYAFQHRIEKIEKQVIKQGEQIEMLVQSTLPPKEGIFFEGQIFDAYHFASQIIKSAKKTCILIDNYVDESVLLLLSKRKKGVKSIIYTRKISKQFELDLHKFNTQYDPIEVKIFNHSHDRFLIIDEQEIYHIGASLKDLGKKWFAFSKLKLDALLILSKLETN
jgi:hypothetical protein